MWYHLSRIEYFFTHNISITQVINKELWPYIWGEIFKIFDVEDVLVRAKIIHIIQTLISFFVIYFVSQVIIRNLFRRIDGLTLRYLSLWAVFIWFTIYATFSVAYHQVWIMWYSINYQITLIIFWYIVALSLIITVEKQFMSKSLFYLFQIIFFSIVILWMHATEFIYYAMYLLLIFTLFFNRIFSVYRTYFLQISIVLIILVYGFYYFLTQGFIYRDPQLFNHFSTDLYTKIMSIGKVQVEMLSRSFASMNELIYLSLLLILIMFIVVIKNRDKDINIKFLLLLFISSLFVLIPINTFASGVASMLIHEAYVNRFYYASSVFIVLPVVVYYFVQLQNLKDMLIKVNIIIFTILMLIFFYSKELSNSSNYYKNVISLINSFSNEKVGLNYSMNYVNIINNQLSEYKQRYKGKKVFYYARGDISYIIKYILKEDNIFIERRELCSKEKFLTYCKEKGFEPVIFRIPNGFPKDKILFENFDFEMK